MTPRPRPRLLIVITLAEVGGAQTYVASLLPAVRERFDVTVAAYGPGPLVAAASAAGVDYVPLRYVRRAVHPWLDLRGLVELVRLFRRVRPDVVHLNSSKAGVLGAVAARIARVPAVVFTVNGWAFNNFRSSRTVKVYLWGARLIGRLSDRIVCVAERERELGLAARVCTPEQAVVIHNAVDVGSASVASPGNEPPRVITVGRFAYPKDFVTLVRALDGVEAETLVVGDGPDRDEIEREIARTGARVQLLGERDDVPEQLAASHVFVLSSRSEGLPLSILEAMAAGLPVIASDVGGVPELVADGETGFVVPVGDEDALREALRRLVADSKLRARMGAASRRRAQEHFDLPLLRRAHLGLYESLLPKRARR